MERPLIFSGEMVKALLEDRKTQTRRIVKPQPSPESVMHCNYGVGWSESLRCPYGLAGDRLWVRETWQQVHPCQVAKGRFSLPGEAGIPGPPPVKYRVIYRADGHEWLPLHGIESHPYRAQGEATDKAEREFQNSVGENHITWCPSIHMPKWASRITLEITKVRVERATDSGVDDGGKPYKNGDWLWVLDFKRHRSGDGTRSDDDSGIQNSPKTGATAPSQ